MFTTRPTIHSYALPAEGPEAHAATLAALGEARHEVDLLMYALTDPLLSGALAAASARGVKVQIILDAIMASDAAERKLLTALLTAGLGDMDIWLTSSEHGAYMHRKLCVIDPPPHRPSLVITGSANWSKSGFFAQDNEVIVSPSQHYAAAEQARFYGLLAWAKRRGTHLQSVTDIPAGLTMPAALWPPA